MTTSRWIGTDTVPPIPALAPNAMCTVPRIFSSSSTLPVSSARSLVPTPSSARLVPASPWARRRSRYSGPSPPSAAVIRPADTVNVAGSLSPSGARLVATSCPSPLSGAMNPSPQGRLPKAPRRVRSPSSAMPSRPWSSSVRSVPRGQETTARSDCVSSSATARERWAILAKSTAITRASMSSVTPGIVAPRAPPSLARLRAVVWLSERVVGAMNTSQASSAAATGLAGSVPSVARSSIRARTASAPAAAAASRSASPIRRLAGSAITTTSSPSPTARQRLTTASTAGARSGTAAS